MKNERAKFVNIYVKVESTKKHEKQNMENIMSDFENIIKENDRTIRKSLEFQKSLTKQRLEERSKKNIDEGSRRSK